MRLFGEVDYDERLLGSVTARTAGWIESLSKKVSWEEVEEGEVLLELYGPELFAAQEEYRVAVERGGALLAAAREKLLLLGVSERDLEAVGRGDAALSRVPYRSPRRGVIARRSAVEGAHVMEGEELFAVADLTRVWLQLEAFESDLPYLRLGTPVTVEPEWDDEPELAGRIAFRDPVVDRVSRTLRVRVEVENRRRADGTWVLVPGQRVRARARLALGADGEPLPPGEEPVPALAVPRSALLVTGERTVVYVLYTDEEDAGGERARRYELDPRRLPPRVGYELVEVRVGALAQRADAEGRSEYYPLHRTVAPVPRIDPNTGVDLSALALRRLREGQLLAGKGALLLDSQAQLAGRPSLLYPEGRAGAAAGAATDPHAGH